MTLVIYVIAYVKTNSHNMFITVFACSVYLLFMTLGYYSVRLSNTEYSRSLKDFEYSNWTRVILIGAAIVTIVISFVNVFTFYSSTQLVLDYITNPGAAYEYVKYIRRNEITDSGMISISSFLGITLNTLTFTKFIVIIYLPLFWKKISRSVKAICITSLVIYIIHAFLIGAMINIGIVVFSLFPVFLFMTNGIKSRVKAMPKISKYLFGALLVLAMLVIVFFMGTRYISVNSGIGEVFVAGITGLSYYISHGYVGLSTCFDLPFESTYGTSTFRGLASTFLSNELYNSLWSHSYLMRNQMKTGWKALQVWSTIFPWLASDISFLLIPVVMLFMGRFMGKVWRIAITERNENAFLMMSQLMIFAFMIPANNQLFHSYGNSVGTILIYLMYRASISKKRIAVRIRWR